jgi:hypothetical protein
MRGFLDSSLLDVGLDFKMFCILIKTVENWRIKTAAEDFRGCANRTGALNLGLRRK